MKPVYYIIGVLALAVTMLRSNSCKGPYNLPVETIAGFVIGRESCKSDAAQVYWLIDFTVNPNSPKVGDTLVINGVTYTNLLKLNL